MQQAILFDFGGTLDADGVHWSSRFYSHYLSAGLMPERSRFDRAFHEADEAISRQPGRENMSFYELLHRQVLLQFEGLTLPADERRERITAACYAAAKATLDRNVRVLERLSSSYLLGIVSNFSGNLLTVCREFGLDKLFKVILDSGVVGLSKPDPALFELALAQLDCEARQCYFVGDSYERDVLPAKRLGMKTVWLIDGMRQESRPSQAADFVIHALPELIPILENDHV